MMDRIFKIRRFDPAYLCAPRYQEFKVKTWEKMSVLEGLLQIQDRLDGSLVFRYACRWAVCGSCAVMINRRIRLACRIQLQSLKGLRILIEPLPGLQVIRDLVVDLEPFWESYRIIKPWLESDEEVPEREWLMSEVTRSRIDQYVNCILCASCYGACPVIRMDKDNKVYLGPATLAKAYRFLVDPRNVRADDMLRELDCIAGVWGCHQVLRCTLYCPKNVRPSDGIMGIRRSILRHRLKGRKSSK